jgi:NADPH-dependent glutamate synthase beta subunit-like oxidoreductase
MNIPLKHATALTVAPDATAPAAAATAQDFHWLRQSIPCQSACPAGTDIPGYLEAVYHGRFAEAYEINLRDNVFPAVLGRVCSRPCEAACRHGWEGNGVPVAICFSKRSAADFAHREPVVLPPLVPPSGRHVAVVGAGVAGLSAARELARLGHRVTVLEKHERPGGMLNQGIPAFRLPRDHIEREIDQIVGMVVLPGELEEYLAEGGRLENECAPVAFLGGANGVRAVRFVRTRAGEPGRDGRRLPMEIPDSRFDVQADVVILATTGCGSTRTSVYAADGVRRHARSTRSRSSG